LRSGVAGGSRIRLSSGARSGDAARERPRAPRTLGAHSARERITHARMTGPSACTSAVTPSYQPRHRVTLSHMPCVRVSQPACMHGVTPRLHPPHHHGLRPSPTLRPPATQGVSGQLYRCASLLYGVSGHQSISGLCTPQPRLDDVAICETSRKRANQQRAGQRSPLRRAASRGLVSPPTTSHLAF
jgi:hypothetical protein